MWYFRREVFSSVHNIVFKFLFPLLGGIMLATVFVISVRESMNPENASGGSIFGIGLVFYMGFGILLLGAVLMWSCVSAALTSSKGTRFRASPRIHLPSARCNSE